MSNLITRFRRILMGDESQLETGITPTGTIQITENGIHDVTEYAEAEVSVGSSLNLMKVNITNNLGTTIQGSFFNSNGEYTSMSGPRTVFVPMYMNFLSASIGVFSTARKLTTISATATDDQGRAITCFVGHFDFSNSNIFTVGLYKNGSFNGTEITVTLTGS